MSERRSNDRRSADRRLVQGRRRDDSLFGALASDSQGEAESVFDPGWLAAGDAPADSRFMRRQARRIARAQDSALARIYRTYAAARAAIGFGLVTVLGVASLLGVRASEALALVAMAYALQAISLWLLPRFFPLTQPQQQRSQRRRQWAMTIGVDLVAFTLLHVSEVGSTFNFAALLVLPVLMAGVLTSRLLALATASGVALVLLLAALRNAPTPELPGLMLQTGLAGLGLFVITLLAGELAGRLAREELAARGSLELARQQAQLNRLVIEEMVDGVLVVDHRLRVRAANPAARALLVEVGLSPPAPFMLHERPAWQALQQAVQQALQDGSWPEAGRDVSLAFGDGTQRTLRMRVRFMNGPQLDTELDAEPDHPETPAPSSAAPAMPSKVLGTEPFVVLLLEDLRTLQARIRQEKLAAMGRVSAGIAHEIRNPLAAISQANALLLEDPLQPDQQQLARIVADNVARLKRLVDDVMEVAPGAPASQTVIELRSTLQQQVSDWMRTVGLDGAATAELSGHAGTRLPHPSPQNGRLAIDLGLASVHVVFDPEHLRRVLINLLDNALRHASEAPGAVLLRLVIADAHHASIEVLSDGQRIAPDIERYLFEPFFSSRSRGTGLGLYICRELCERYGASVEYQQRPLGQAHPNAFVVSLYRAVPGSPS